MALTIAVAQCNPVAGDLAGNTRLIVDAARKAHAQGAQLLLLPDGAFTGVPLRDLARRPAFVQACEHHGPFLFAVGRSGHGLSFGELISMPFKIDIVLACAC